MTAEGKKLRVSVTKTTAQGRDVQSTAPNVMSFSTDENSVWFNGRKYGVTLLKDLFDLFTGASEQEIKKALGVNTYDELSALIDAGTIFISEETNDKALVHVSVRKDVISQDDVYLYFELYLYNEYYLVSIRHHGGHFEVAENARRGTLLTDGSVVDDLSSSESRKPLSARQGKVLDGKIQELQQRLVPEGMTVDYPARITYGNKQPIYIKAKLTPTGTAQNVIFISDNRAVEVSPDGRLSVLAVGKSTVHVIPTCNTALARTLLIEVAGPSLRTAAYRKNLRLTKDGSFVFT